MPIIPIRELGALGVNRDKSPVLLGPNEWSDARNVRFHNGSVNKRLGYTKAFDTELLVAPENVLYWPRPVTDYYIYAGDSDVYRTDGTSAGTSITDTDFSAEGKWQSSLFNGGYTVIANNTVDIPQYITYGTSGSNFENFLTPLPDWPSGLSCGVIRGHRNALIAGNLTDSSGSETTYMPGTIRVSAQAAPGAVPSSWTVGATLTTTADEFELSTTSPVQEIVDLRGLALIFTEDSIHSLSLAQNNSATTVRNLNYGTGCLAPGCAIEVYGQVLAVDKTDIYTTSGSGSIKSVAHDKVRDYFFRTLSDTHYKNTFILDNGTHDEAWICYPDTDSSGPCNTALVWNYHYDHWTIFDIPECYSGDQGPDQLTTETKAEHLLLGTVDSDYLMVMDKGTTFDGQNFTAYVERMTLDMGDLETAVWTGKVFPVVTGTGSIDISVKGTNAAGTPATFTKSQEFDIASDYKVEPRDNGRFFNIRFETSDDADWKLASYSLKVDNTDRR